MCRTASSRIHLEHDQKWGIAGPLQEQLSKALAVDGDDRPEGRMVNRRVSPIPTDTGGSEQDLETLLYRGAVVDLCWEEPVDNLGDNFGRYTVRRCNNSVRGICWCHWVVHIHHEVADRLWQVLDLS